MPLIPEAKRILDMMAAGAARPDRRQTIAERREGFRKLMRLAAAPVSIGRIDERTVTGAAGFLAARVYAAREGSAGLLPGLIYFHGGGLVAGGLDTHDCLCRLLAKASGCRVVAVDYRLAPEHRFPAAVEDACAAVDCVARHAGDFGIDPLRLAVGGDSAGGTLAAVACLWARERGGPHIAVQLLLCPVLDFVEAWPSRSAFARGYLLDQTTMEADLQHYLDGNTNLSDPRISPLRAADLSRLPAALIHTAEFDPLHDEGEAYATALRNAGVQVRFQCHEGMIHHFYGLTSIIPQAQSALEAIGAELRSTLG